MKRIIPNILEEADRYSLTASTTARTAAARYGADLIGRAIGHEHQADPIDLGGWAPVIADIRTGWTPARIITMHAAISEILTGA